MSILEIKNLSLELDGKSILRNFNLIFGEGEVHALVGPNGAGKSSFAYTVMGLDGYSISKGGIFYGGRDISRLSVDKRAQSGITLAWQEPARYEGLLVKDFLAAAAADKSQENIESALERMGLSCRDYLSRALDEKLSGGERKKIELASILIMDASFVILDEPDSGIDIESLEKIFEAIKFLKQKGVTVLLITHSLAVLRQADRAYLMCDGEVIDSGSSEKIIPYFENRCIPCPHKNVPESRGN